MTPMASSILPCKLSRIFTMDNNMKKSSQKGFSLIEIMIVIAVLAVISAGIYMSLYSGQEAWATAEAETRLGNGLRLTLERVSRELRESGSTAGVLQVAIEDGEGTDNTDILRFSIPILCETEATILDENGDVSSWGAPLRWGCTDSSCMDADDDCSTADYVFLEYRINDDNQIVRRVLNAALGLVREDLFAENISDFQAQLSADQNVVTITMSGAQASNTSREISVTRSMDVFLRNRS